MTTTPSTCSRCKGTGYLPRKFYTAVRHCSCPVGRDRQTFDAMSIDERSAYIDAQVAATREAQRAARHARRDARRAAGGVTPPVVH